MRRKNDFVIEDGMLVEYVGRGVDVEIPDGVISIGDYAFHDCSRLTSVTIPDSVTSIGDAAFYCCDNLTNVTISHSVKTIGSGAFWWCKNLTSVNISDLAAWCKICFGKAVNPWFADHSLYLNGVPATDLVIPDGVTSIGDYAFERCSNLSSVTIPDSVTSIGDYAFLQCKSLTNVTIGRGVTSIGEAAFSSCLLLTSVTIPDSVTSIGDSAFNYCFRLTSITIPNSVMSIGDKAFAECQRLKHITISDGVKKIGKQCFAGCSELRSISIPASVQTISAAAFSQTGIQCFEVSPLSKKFQAVGGMILSKDGKKLIVYPLKADFDQLPIPGTVEQIAAGAIDDRDGWFVIPKTVLKMAKKAFSKTDDWESFDYFKNKAYVFIYNAAFVDSVPNPIFLGDISVVEPKSKNKLVENFLHAVECDRPEIEPYKAVYAEHIRKNPKSYIKWISKNENLFRFFIQEKLIPKNWVEKVLIELEQKNRSDLKAELLAYQQENFPKKGKDSFSLSDDDPELKRRMEMDKRREEIKNQKGIQGIAFVATGDLARFGDYNEYTGAVDRSDLKRFIEARGGFLRSAVSSKTDYLICNDPNEDSEKTKKAKELGVMIIDEAAFLKMADEGLTKRGG